MKFESLQHLNHAHCECIDTSVSTLTACGTQIWIALLRTAKRMMLRQWPFLSPNQYWTLNRYLTDHRPYLLHYRTNTPGEHANLPYECNNVKTPKLCRISTALFWWYGHLEPLGMHIWLRCVDLNVDDHMTLPFMQSCMNHAWFVHDLASGKLVLSLDTQCAKFDTADLDLYHHC